MKEIIIARLFLSKNVGGGTSMGVNCFISLFITALLPTLSVAQQTAKSFVYGDNKSMGYLEYLPPGYDTATAKYPVLIFLHGGGEGGNGSPGDLEKLKSWGPPRLIYEGHDMCFTVEGKKECFIVISPQIVTEIHNFTFFVPYVIDHVLSGPENYKADPERVYLTGLSRGGFGTYDFAASPLNEPNVLAAIAPMSAWGETTYDGCVIAKRKIPVWAFHGKKDTVIPYAQGLIAFNEIKYCTSPEPDAELIFTTYEDRYHDAWIPGYDPTHTYHNPNLYEWLLLHTRPEPGIVTAVNEQPHIHPFSIHPNPAKESIALRYHGEQAAGSRITLRNVSGALITEFAFGAVLLDISSLNPGVYILQIVYPSGTIATERLIKL